MRFFKKIQDWILKSERIRKWILRFFTRRINPRSFGSWCVKGTEESSLEVDSSVPLTHHDPKDLGLICLVKKRKIYFRILSDFRIQSSIFLKKRTQSLSKLLTSSAKCGLKGANVQKNRHSRTQSCDPLGQRHGSRALARANFAVRDSRTSGQLRSRKV